MAAFGIEFACASTLVLAFKRMFDRVMSAEAAATSVSRIREFAAEIFSFCTPKLSTVDCNLLSVDSIEDRVWLGGIDTDLFPDFFHILAELITSYNYFV